jgi:hypothetical protein
MFRVRVRGRHVAAREAADGSDALAEQKIIKSQKEESTQDEF